MLSTQPIRFKRFVLFSMPRTGSTMVADGLFNVEGIVCLQSIFSKMEWASRDPFQDQLKRELGNKWNALETRVARPYEFLREILKHIPEEGLRAFGFKHHLALDRSVTKLILKNAAYSKIMLRRRNLLASYSSNELVKVTGQGKARVGDTLIEAKCMFSADEFNTYCYRRNKVIFRWESEFKPMCRGSILEVEYADVRQPNGFSPILSLLGLDASTPVVPQSVQRWTSNIIDRFENPEDALVHLKAIGKLEWTVER